MISVVLTNEAVEDKISDLGLSVFIGNMKRVKKLLKKNDINSKFMNNNSLLHISANNEDANMFYFLISNGCDYQHVNDYGDTCLHIIAMNNNVYCLEVLCQYNIENIINKKNKEGDTALHLAIKNGFYNVCAMLLENGADALIKDDFGMNCYEIADILKKKEKFYDSGSVVFSNILNLVARSKQK